MDKTFSPKFISEILAKYPARGSFEVQGKTVNIPAVYKGEGLTAVFPISYEKAAKIIDSHGLKPAKLLPGKALLSITVFDFIDSPVGPYTELVYAIPILYKSKMNLPLLPIIFGKHSENFGFYVLDIMQSTEIAVAHGNLLTGYPHNSNLIDVKFTHDRDNLYVKVNGKSGLVIEIRGAINGNQKFVEDLYMTYFIKDNQPFKIRMDIFGNEKKVNRGIINIGKNVLADVLQNLDISTRSLQTKYYPNVVEINPVTLEHL